MKLSASLYQYFNNATKRTVEIISSIIARNRFMTMHDPNRSLLQAMTAQNDIRTEEEVLASSQVPGKNLYIVGTFDSGVTVLNQQTRALNLVWALTERKNVPCLAPGDLTNEDPGFSIAIVGAGFAGLSVAAGLLSKGVKSKITVFEQRDTLLPLQHGSDTRWLHPHIYNWPSNGSEASAAMLPVLNWTAARASDVVVQVLSEWKTLASSSPYPPKVYCNARHLQVDTDINSNAKLRIEWIGEERSPVGSMPEQRHGANAVGRTELFDAVIIATGFGLEKDNALSYWRNDIVGQPNLEQSRRVYLVSGQGDGAMIDLLRVRISHYRQDRILAELFTNSQNLLVAIKSLYERVELHPDEDLFAGLEKLSERMPAEFNAAIESLSNRLRRDTDAILHLKIRKIADLFNSSKIRISFQNKMIVYFLYKCGGFVPSTECEKLIAAEHRIPEDRVLKRHGTDRLGPLKSLLSEELYSIVNNHRANDSKYKFQQTDKPLWYGGFFGFYGTTEAIKGADVSGSITSQWRKEYLPGPTELVAAAFCASLAGILKRKHPIDKRLRVTLHRAINFGSEEVLQQCCEYFGTGLSASAGVSAGRAFPAENATIGLAYSCRRIIRSIKGVEPADLELAMQHLQLRTASGKMVSDIHYILAIPILEPEGHGCFIGPTPVAGIVYVDSTASNYFLTDPELEEIVRVTAEFVSALERSSSAYLNRITNVPVGELACNAPATRGLPAEVEGALEFVDGIDPPRAVKKFHFNFDYSDFIPVGERPNLGLPK